MLTKLLGEFLLRTFESGACYDPVR